MQAWHYRRHVAGSRLNSDRWQKHAVPLPLSSFDTRGYVYWYTEEEV